MFAYACDPSRGSEPGAGAKVAAIVSGFCDEVIVITRREPGLDASVLARQIGSNVRVVQVGPSSKIPITYLRYVLWILAAVRTAGPLRAEGPAVIHHLTYGSDWFVNPFVFMPKKGTTERWIWGPAGGSTYAPYAVGRAVTKSLALSELIRLFSTQPLRRVVHRQLRKRVDVALAQNPDSANTFTQSQFRTVVVQPHVVLEYADLPRRDPATPPVLVYAGRGVGWKGLALVIDSSSYLPLEWTLIVAGDGTDSAHYRGLAAPHADRVTFLGPLDREETLDLIARATAFALPSLHDSAGWAAAEASGIGTPVVCLDLGGVPLMAGINAVVIHPKPVRDLARRFASAVLSTAEGQFVPDRSHTSARLRATLERAYFPEDPG